MATVDDKDLYSGLIRLHILHHASQQPIFGFWMVDLRYSPITSVPSASIEVSTISPNVKIGQMPLDSLFARLNL
jgi:hypothetical protein